MDTNVIEINHHASLVLAIFIIGYIFIIIEEVIKLNKTATALLMAVLCWMVLFLDPAESAERHLYIFTFQMFKVSQVLFFLMGALAIVEIINAHKGFQIITRHLILRSKRKMLWITGFVTFFMSSVLDNLTTTIVMVALIAKLVEEREERLILAGIIVVAANVGGAWTPMGDVPTTLLWITNRIDTFGIMRDLLLPCMAAMTVCLLWFHKSFKGEFKPLPEELKGQAVEPGGTTVLIVGICSLIFVPIFKILTDLPPFMGMICGLGILWVVTDILHFPYRERWHLRVISILPKVDISIVLFYLGILLSISALETAGLLNQMSHWLNAHVSDPLIVPVLIGLVSSFIDNVALVAATIGMYNLDQFGTDTPFWQTITYCTGIGGSILIIGSAAGIALMALEKVTFMWYAKNITIPALLAYFAGLLVYFLLSPFTRSIS